MSDDVIRIPSYQVHRELGRGAMGVVYLARQTSLGRDVALKVLPKEGVKDEALRRFLREVQLCVALSHPHVVKLLDAGATETLAYLAMEMIDGSTLEQWVFDNGPMKPGQLLAAMESLADALEFIHSRKIVHRDIKSSNIMMDRVGGLKLMDFGLARGAASETLTREGAIVGSPRFMAPETLVKGTMDALSDMYSLGIVFYEMATATRLFEAPTLKECLQAIVSRAVAPPVEIEPDLPRPISELIMHTIARDRTRRPGGMPALLQAIREVRGGREFLGTSLQTSRPALVIDGSGEAGVGGVPESAGGTTPQASAGRSAAPAPAGGTRRPTTRVRSVTVHHDGRRTWIAVGVLGALLVAGLLVARSRSVGSSAGLATASSAGAHRAEAIARFHGHARDLDLKQVVGTLASEIGSPRAVRAGVPADKGRARLADPRAVALRILSRWRFHASYLDAFGALPADGGKMSDPTPPGPDQPASQAGGAVSSRPPPVLQDPALTADDRWKAYEGFLVLSHIDDFLENFCAIGPLYRAQELMRPWVVPLEPKGQTATGIIDACQETPPRGPCLTVHRNLPGQEVYLFAGLDPVREEMTYTTLTPEPTGYKKQEDDPRPRLELGGPYRSLIVLALTRYVYPLRFIQIDLAPLIGEARAAVRPRTLVLRSTRPYADPEEDRFLGVQVSRELVPFGRYEVRIRSFRLWGSDNLGCRLTLALAKTVP